MVEIRPQPALTRQSAPVATALRAIPDAKARGRRRVAEAITAVSGLTEWEHEGWTYNFDAPPFVKLSEKDHLRAAAAFDLTVRDEAGIIIFHDRIQAWDGTPVLVPDGTQREEADERGEKLLLTNFREDPVEGAKLDLSHTVKVVTKGGRSPWVKAKPGTVSTFYSGTGDGFLQGQGSTWSEARGGSGTIALNTLNTYFTSGCDIPGAFYEANQAGFAFDTSAVPDTDEVSAATLSLYVSADLSDVDSTHEVRVVAFGTLTTADFVAGASLSGITRVASIATSGLSGAAYNNFTEDGTNLRDAVSLTGLTELWLTDSVQLSATNPSGRSMVRWSSANEAGTTQDPKLVVTHAPPTATATSVLVTPFPVMSTTGKQVQTATSIFTPPFPIMSTQGKQVQTAAAVLISPFPVMSASGVYTPATAIGESVLIAPFPVLYSSGLQKQLGTAALIPPFPVVYSQALQVISNVDAPLILPFPIVSAEGRGNIYTATSALIAPFPILYASGEQKILGSSILVSPFPILYASGIQVLTATSQLTLPFPILYSEGTHTDIQGVGILILPFPILTAAGQTIAPPYILTEYNLRFPNYSRTVNISNYSLNIALPKRIKTIQITPDELTIPLPNPNEVRTIGS